MEIKASELRVGNLVFLCNDIVSIEGIDSHENIKVCGYYPLAKLQPIPISEEILLNFKAKFKKNIPFFDIHMPRNIGYISINPNNNMIWLRHHTTRASLNPGSIHYLHQLQNLYFALTGEELEVNP